MTYSKTIKLEGTEQAVEQAIHELQKESKNAKRYGVDLEISRVEPESEHTGGFDE